MMDLTQAFKCAAYGQRNFCQAVDLVCQNAQGGVWVIGSYVFGSLASALYDAPPSCGDISCGDIDFIVENSCGAVQLPRGWSLQRNRCGNPKFVKDGLRVDYVPLSTVSSIVRRGLEPTIENYLRGTPLTVQSIAFDVRTSKVIGLVGMRAVQERTVAVHDPVELVIASELKGLSVEAYLTRKADKLRFTPVFS